MPFPWWGACLGIFCFPLEPPFSPRLVCIFSYSKSSEGDPPPSRQAGRHGTVGKLTSQPSHSELKGVISFLSHPQRQGKEASTPARKKALQLLRSHTNTPLRSCSWKEGGLLMAAPPQHSACPLGRTVTRKALNQSSVGLSASLLSQPHQ